MNAIMTLRNESMNEIGHFGAERSDAHKMLLLVIMILILRGMECQTLCYFLHIQ